MSARQSNVLIIGATGTQGGAAARELLSAGYRVRILVRNPDSPAALALVRLGAEPVKGDLDDPATLVPGLQDAYGVFSVQRPDLTGTDSERRQGLALIAAARKAGVVHFVHSSVCQVDQHQSFPRWGQGYWNQKYWTDKWEVEQAVRGAGFAHWTVLRPSFIMENFAPPKAPFLFPQLRQGTLLTPVLPAARLQLIAGDDIGAFACAAVANATLYDRKVIELAGDALTMSEAAAVLSQGLGKRVVAKSVSPEEALAAGIAAMWVRSQEWINVVGYHVKMEDLAPYGISLTRLSNWVDRHRNDIVIDT
jgi:uncharacterized protein YbjT (DUF2867 family)